MARPFARWRSRPMDARLPPAPRIVPSRSGTRPRTPARARCRAMARPCARSRSRRMAPRSPVHRATEPCGSGIWPPPPRFARSRRIQARSPVSRFRRMDARSPTVSPTAPCSGGTLPMARASATPRSTPHWQGWPSHRRAAHPCCWPPPPRACRASIPSSTRCSPHPPANDCRHRRSPSCPMARATPPAAPTARFACGMPRPATRMNASPR